MFFTCMCVKAKLKSKNVIFFTFIKDAAAKTNDDQNFDDDLIELNGCQVQTFWRWPPKLSHCPNSKCKENRFADCETAKKHFIQNHAPYAIFCELCEKPIASPTLSNYKKHYSRLHPKEKIPIGLGEKSTTFDRKYCTRNGKTVKKVCHCKICEELKF